ncbi:MAG TPA: glycoside hydrolase 100 family protein, partial [Ktedonobacteraceae bacterium]|nr:glycoside hydrolase 100 family protein [Ktedonobacteraceae bacterium]
ARIRDRIAGEFDMTFADEAYARSLAQLRRCLSPAGFLGSPNDIDNYARVWARDGIIAGLAAIASGDASLVDGMRSTLLTLARHQGPHGEIPSNVTADGGKVSYGHLVGRVDAPLWYVIGVCAYVHHTGDMVYAASALPGVERALFLVGCWEFNNRGLLYTPLSGNWADEFILEGYLLSDQLLYAMALRNAGVVFQRPAWTDKAASLLALLEVNYWPRFDARDDALVYHPHAYRAYLDAHGEPLHWLAAFSPGGYADRFDGLAHALALLAQLGGDAQRQQAIAYVQQLSEQIGSELLPAFWPVIQPGDLEWQLLQANHLYGMLKNQPFTYHNGGLWAVVTGLYAVGLACCGQRERAGQLLHAINEANARGRDGQQWEFAEYYHAQTHMPMGTSHVDWSAAAGILAHQAMRQDKVASLFFH